MDVALSLWHVVGFKYMRPKYFTLCYGRYKEELARRQALAPVDAEGRVYSPPPPERILEGVSTTPHGSICLSISKTAHP